MRFVLINRKFIYWFALSNKDCRTIISETVMSTCEAVVSSLKKDHMNVKKALPLPLPFLRGGWLHRWWLHPARRPQLRSNAQLQINRYGYVNLFEAFANLKRVLKRSCLNTSEDIMGAPIMSLLIAILATQEPRKWSEVSLPYRADTRGPTEVSWLWDVC